MNFLYTDILEIDNYFSKIKERSSEITQKLQALQYAKSYFFHKLHLPALFITPNPCIAMVSLVLYLVASGNKIEFIDACPYLQVQNEIELFSYYTSYIAALHECIVTLTETKPEMQEFITTAKSYIKKISYIADKEGFDLCRKLNSVAIMIKNCKILWDLPNIIENRLWAVKKDLMDIKLGIRECGMLSLKFSDLYGTCSASVPETIRLVWHEPSQLKV